MSWQKVDVISIAEAFEIVKKEKGVLKIRKVVRKGENAIEFYLWVKE